MNEPLHVYRNGVILTMDGAGSVQHLMVDGNRIVATSCDLESFDTRGREVIYTDLKGKTLLPGFYDGHSHFIREGVYNLFYLNINPIRVPSIRSIADIAALVREKAEVTPEGGLIGCWGYDDSALAEQRHITLEELDAMAPRHQLYIRHVSGHLALANSRVFECAGVSSRTPPPEGSRIVTDNQGRLTGLLEGAGAMNLLVRHLAPHGQEDLMKAIEYSGEIYAAQGVTTADEAGISTAIWESYLAAVEQGRLKIRVQLLPRHNGFDFGRTGTSRSGSPIGAQGKLSLGAVKIFYDGSIQGYTAYLSKAYHRFLNPAKNSEDRGRSAMSKEALFKLFSFYHAEGWQVAVHANGDQAIEDVLEVAERVQSVYPRPGSRHLLVHAQCISREQLERVRKLGMMVSFFVPHVYYWGDRHRDIFLGPERAAALNPLRWALEAGVIFSTHNDTYVTPISPLMCVWCAVNRLTASGEVLGPDQRISVLDALRSVTIWSAAQHKEEHLKGSIEPGKLADFAVLDQNPLDVAPEAIKNISVLATIVDGKLVYGEL